LRWRDFGSFSSRMHSHEIVGTKENPIEHLPIELEKMIKTGKLWGFELDGEDEKLESSVKIKKIIEKYIKKEV